MVTLISLISALALAAIPIAIGWRRTVDEAGMARAMGRLDSPPVAEPRTQAAPRLAEMTQQMAPVMLALAAELYAPLSDADFAAYVQMLKTPAGLNLTEASIAALDRVMLESAEELGRLAAPR